MSDKLQQLLSLLDENLTLLEIAHRLSLSPRKVYYYLTLLNNYGYCFTKKYYYDGNIKFQLKHDLLLENDISIITPKGLNQLDFLIISDLHLSSSKERLDLLDKAYNYCIKKGIHLILIAGDIIDGFVGSIPKKYNTSHEQIDYAIKNYPFDPSILNFLVLGNHDYSTLFNNGQDFQKVLANRRYDMIVTGYGEGKIYIKNDLIVLRHPIKLTKEQNESFNKTLIIKGHTHNSKTWSDYNNFLIYAPTLSNISNDGILPGMIHMSLGFLQGYLKKCDLYHLTYFLNDFYVTNETEVYLTNGKPFKKNNQILYEEEMVKVLKK